MSGLWWGERPGGDHPGYPVVVPAHALNCTTDNSCACRNIGGLCDALAMFHNTPECRDLGVQQVVSKSTSHGLLQGAGFQRLRHRHEGMDPVVDSRMDALRAKVADLLNPEEDKHGGDRRSEEYQGDIVTLKTDRGNDPDYALRRLKRDNPDLAQRVLKGELSAHAAAVQAQCIDRQRPPSTIGRSPASSSVGGPQRTPPTQTCMAAFVRLAG